MGSSGINNNSCNSRCYYSNNNNRFNNRCCYNNSNSKYLLTLSKCFTHTLPNRTVIAIIVTQVTRTRCSVKAKLTKQDQGQDWCLIFNIRQKLGRSKNCLESVILLCLLIYK